MVGIKISLGIALLKYCVASGVGGPTHGREQRGRYAVGGRAPGHVRQLPAPGHTLASPQTT